jgi:hypothetical protein
MAIKKSTAWKLAFECIDKEIQRIVFNANLYDKLLVNNPMCRNASRRKKRLEEAKEILGEYQRSAGH